MNARFKFWLITLAALLAVAVTLSLGRWQWSRATQKEALQARIDERATLPELSTRTLAATADPMAHLDRRVRLRGRWLSGRTVFLDNRQMNHKPGLYVVTPMQLEDSEAVILVQRGWVARNFMDRALLPKIETPAQSVEIVGRIGPPPSRLYDFDGRETGLIRQNLAMDRFAAELGLPLLGVSVQQLGAAEDGLLREWPAAGSGVEKNYGYAFQWFALSVLFAVLYVWFQIVRRFIRARRA